MLVIEMVDSMKKQGFAKTLQVISFQVDKCALHGRSTSKCTLISKSRTLYYLLHINEMFNY